LTSILALSACCDSKSLPVAMQNLYSAQPSERNEAALELARCGADAERAVPRLAQLLYDPNVGVQSAAAYALRKIDTESARNVLDQAMARKRAR
jgi:HEAT repeat protein